MSHNVADGAPLVAAAVQAAIRESASVRMVAAVAAAVAGKVLSAAAQPTWHATKRKEHTPDAPTGIDVEAGDPVQWLAALRCSRRSQRQRKKERRRLAKQAAQLQSSSPPQSHQPQHADAITDGGAAGPRAEPEGASAAVPALAPTGPRDRRPPGLYSPEYLQLHPAPAALSPAGSDGSERGSAPPTLRPLSSTCGSVHTLRADDNIRGSGHASAAASAGMARPDRHAPYSTNRPKSKSQPRRRQQ